MLACDNNYKFTVVDWGAYDSNNDAGMFLRSAFYKALFSDKLIYHGKNAKRKKMKRNYVNGFHKISIIACLRFDFSGSGILSNSVTTNNPKLLSGVKLLKFQANC